jgi:hypothetical protein
MPNTHNLLIYKEILNSNYQIEEIIIHLSSNKKIITLEIFFENETELIGFMEYLFKKKNLNLNSDIHNKSIIISLHTNPKKTYWDFVLTELFYPSNTNSMIFKIDKEIVNPDEPIKLTNIPEKISQLKIESKITVDLTNLPTGLKLLDLSRLECYSNLDYLPESLQILYLPWILASRSHVFNIGINKYKYYYSLNQLANLPIGLNQIYLNNIPFSSVENLFHNFNNKIECLSKP